MTIRHGLRCSSTVASDRGGGHGSILPFLYHTTTILPCRRYASSSAGFATPSNKENRKNQYVRQRRPGLVPFDKTSETPEPNADLPSSTITPTEKRAFESLLGIHSSKKHSSGLIRKVQPSRHSRSPTFSDAEYERRASRLDAILDGALANVHGYHEPKLPEALHETVGAARDRMRAQSEDLERDQKRLEAAMEAENLTISERKRIDETRDLMRNASTDFEVWRVFKGKVIDVLRGLKWDGLPGYQAGDMSMNSGEIAGHNMAIFNKNETTDRNPSSDDENGILLNTGESAIPTNNPAALANILPVRISQAQLTLSKSFPSSPFLLSLLPAVRALGPAASTLALSEQHYERHMRYLWQRYQDLPGILKLLQTMEDEVITFTGQTAGLISEVLDFTRNASEGRSGEAVRIVWAMEARRAEVKGLRVWRRKVEESRKEEGLRKARESAVEAEDPELRKASHWRFVTRDEAPKGSKAEFEKPIVRHLKLESSSDKTRDVIDEAQLSR